MNYSWLDADGQSPSVPETPAPETPTLRGYSAHSCIAMPRQPPYSGPKVDRPWYRRTHECTQRRPARRGCCWSYASRNVHNRRQALCAGASLAGGCEENQIAPRQRNFCLETWRPLTVCLRDWCWRLRLTAKRRIERGRCLPFLSPILRAGIRVQCRNASAPIE